tara:strand:+ start:1906 stop:2178 length:273 start_codon:yes stop_codon:yes gene_type:complete
MIKIRVADYITQRSVEAGAKHIFLVTGGGVMLAGQKKCVDSTPMVSIEEGLDSHVEEVVTAIGGEEDLKYQKKRLIQSKKEDVTLIKMHK